MYRDTIYFYLSDDAGLETPGPNANNGIEAFSGKQPESDRFPRDVSVKENQKKKKGIRKKNKCFKKTVILTITTLSFFLDTHPAAQ